MRIKPIQSYKRASSTRKLLVIVFILVLIRIVFAIITNTKLTE